MKHWTNGIYKTDDLIMLELMIHVVAVFISLVIVAYILDLDDEMEDNDL